ncbi:hypothetical protein HPP92_004888 [Vanilla planifolia]|uniref:Uncharacterized protein n=1 Tax=Vanilla planifolia TaxID=51239 RepID=A0A835RLS1_VANPL|nr:hypothetical protein HPP92_004888 [Vanilla planifolia]
MESLVLVVNENRSTIAWSSIRIYRVYRSRPSFDGIRTQSEHLSNLMHRTCPSNSSPQPRHLRHSSRVRVNSTSLHAAQRFPSLFDLACV